MKAPYKIKEEVFNELNLTTDNELLYYATESIFYLCFGVLNSDSSELPKLDWDSFAAAIANIAHNAEDIEPLVNEEWKQHGIAFDRSMYDIFSDLIKRKLVE